MKVLLVNPSYWPGGRIPLGFVSVSAVPLGLGYLAGMLETRGVPVKILDMNKGGRDEGRLKEKISSYDPDIVGITSFTSNFGNAVRTARIVKSMKPETVEWIAKAARTPEVSGRWRARVVSWAGRIPSWSGKGSRRSRSGMQCTRRARSSGWGDSRLVAPIWGPAASI